MLHTRHQLQRRKYLQSFQDTYNNGSERATFCRAYTTSPNTVQKQQDRCKRRHVASPSGIDVRVIQTTTRKNLYVARRDCTFDRLQILDPLFASLYTEFGRHSQTQRQSSKGAKAEEKDAKAANKTMTLRVSDLLPIATHIQKTKPAVIVPQHIVRYVHQAIVARRSCADWFAKSTSHEDGRESNARHEYVINVLENVLKILSPLALPRKEQSSSKWSALNVVEVSNMFQDLHVDETEDSDLNLVEYEPTKTQTTAPTVRIILETDESEVEQEFLLAVYCFAKTMNELREYVMSL